MPSERVSQGSLVSQGRSAFFFQGTALTPHNLKNWGKVHIRTVVAMFQYRGGSKSLGKISKPVRKETHTPLFRAMHH